MSGDYSRNGFDPSLDDLGVLLQQGRPLTDRDWNDLVLQFSRRIQAGTLDTLGGAAVPAQTPDAFKIELDSEMLTIARGRIYVDGLLAENHGAPPADKPLDWDPRLAEQYGSEALVYAEKTDYTTQPYYPNPPNLPSSSGKHLVYLDVWQREVTHYMREGIVEPALGVDTSTRLQTVWQVKVLADVGSNASCATDLGKLKGWLPQNAPSAGRLSSDTAQVPGQPDPCEVPPANGYKGRENQLYRVEIHQGGAPGKATFKWSRDNASIETGVTAIPTADQLVVESVGRDPVLRFSDGDWIEITDDWLELHNEPGVLRQIKTDHGVDDVMRTITLENGLGSDAVKFPTNAEKLIDPLRHTRIRRWDQKGKVLDAAGKEIADANAKSGCITVPADATTQILLEDGVVISFSVQPTGGEFRSGDYWVFTARAGDASIEKLQKAPPRGIHHHYAPLGIWDAASDKVADDCRTPWPTACGGCCTVTVAPGESIQAALDSLPEEGGCVCLKTGIHEVAAAIEIRASNVILRGEGPGAVVHSGGDAVLRIIGEAAPVTDVAVEAVRFEAAGAVTGTKFGTILEVNGCSRLRVDRCEMVATSSSSGDWMGASLNDVAEVVFTRNRVGNVVLGVQIGDYKEQVEVTRNRIEGVSVGYPGYFSGAPYGVLVNDANHDAACRIEHNFIRDFWTGVYLREEAAGSVIADNRIRRSAGSVTDVFPADPQAFRRYLNKRVYAIDVEAADCVVRSNHVDLLSPAWGGIRVSAARGKVLDNVLEAEQGRDPGLVPAGIYCLAHPVQGRGANNARVSGNTLLGSQIGIVMSRIDDATIAANRIDGGKTGWYGVLVDDCRDTCVRDNDIREVWFAVHLGEGERNRVLGNQVQETLSGITLDVSGADLEVSSNTLVSCQFVGIALLFSGAATLIKNRVMNCGYAGLIPFGPFGGIMVVGEGILLQQPSAILRIEDCEVIDTGISPDGQEVSQIPVVGIGAWAPACRITGNRVGYSVQPQQGLKLKTDLEHRALFLLGPLALLEPASLQPEDMSGSALVNGNHFSGPGRSTLVEFYSIAYQGRISRFEKVTFSNNVCEHWSAEPKKKAATIHLLGGQLIALGNHVKADKGVNAMSLGSSKYTVLVGNITTGNYIDEGAVTPSPIANFNVIV